MTATRQSTVINVLSILFLYLAIFDYWLKPFNGICLFLLTCIVTHKIVWCKRELDEVLDKSFIRIVYKSESDFCSTCFISPSAKYFANCSSASISLYTDTISSELQPTSI